MLRHGAGKNPCPEPPFAALSEEAKIGHAAKEAAERIRDIGDPLPRPLWRMARYRMASLPLHAPRAVLRNAVDLVPDRKAASFGTCDAFMPHLCCLWNELHV